MTTAEKQQELKNKIVQGLDLAYKRMIEHKKEKGLQIAVMQDNRVVFIKPE